MRMNRTQKGITIIEAVGALAIASMLLLGLSSMIDVSIADAKGQQAALHQGQVVNAAGKYISANYADLVSATASGSVAAVTLAQLKTGGFLPGSFADTNIFNQTPCVLVRQSASGKLDALVATYGGQAIPEHDIAMAAMLSGQGGGYISTAVPGTARGASWSLDTSAYRNVACGGKMVLTGAAANDGGHLVSSLFYDGPGQLSTDFLYRNAVPGRPELNRLNTPVAMANSALVAEGAACGSDAAFGMDAATRSFLICGADGKWKPVSSWKDPVGTHGALPAAGNSAGDVRMVKDKNLAFTWNGSNWVALAVDENGNLNVPAALSADSVAATTQITTDGLIAAKGKITAEKDIISNSGAVVGNWVVGRYWVESESFYINESVKAGDPCNIPYVREDGSTGWAWAIGTVKRDWAGIILTCAWDSVFRYQNGELSR